MNDQSYMPEPSVDERLLDNLRYSRSEIEELGLQFEEVIAKLEHIIATQRLKRLSK